MASISPEKETKEKNIRNNRVRYIHFDHASLWKNRRKDMRWCFFFDVGDVGLCMAEVGEAGEDGGCTPIISENSWKLMTPSLSWSASLII